MKGGMAMIVPNETDQHNTERKKIMKKDELKLLKMSDIQVREVDWLWYPYIPFGKLTIIHGDTGGARFYDDSVLNSKGKTVTEVLGVGKKYIPLLQTIDPGPDQLTMIKAFLRDNIRPDLELMKWCSKNDIGEEAYITVPLRYMTPHKLMRYASPTLLPTT